MPYIVAITGGIGSGKSTVANIFYSLGIPLVDADVIARKMVQPGYPALHAIVNRFGKAILRTDGRLNRAMLRERIFSISEDKYWLNVLLHSDIHQQTKKQISFIKAKAPYLIWVVPLLIDNNLQQFADRILVVDVDQTIQISRILTRDQVSFKQVEKIIDSQVSRQERLAYADDIITNQCLDIDQLKDHVTILHHQYIKFSQSNYLPRKYNLW